MKQKFIFFPFRILRWSAHRSYEQKLLDNYTSFPSPDQTTDSSSSTLDWHQHGFSSSSTCARSHVWTFPGVDDEGRLARTSQENNKSERGRKSSIVLESYARKAHARHARSPCSAHFCSRCRAAAAGPGQFRCELAIVPILASAAPFECALLEKCDDT